VDGIGVNSQPLADRVALVTGASSGIGRACALALADAGAAVALGFSANPAGADEVAALIRERGGTATTLGADLAEPSAAAALVDGTLRELGAIDIVVNNAGITRDNLAVRITDADWDAVLAIDLSAAFRVCRAALKPMLRRREGRIVNISSVAGVMGNPGQANYSAAKAGLIGLTKTLSRELGEFGIRVNAILPGAVAGPRLQGVYKARAKESGRPLDEVKAAAMELQSVKHLVDPSEIAALAIFLTSDAGRSISGQALPVDNDMQNAS